MVSRHQSRPDDLELPKYCIELLYDQKDKVVESTGGLPMYPFMKYILKIPCVQACSL